MPRYASWLASGMKERGHQVEIISPKPVAYNLSVPKGLRKWMGYIDQYVLFPKEIRRRLLRQQDTLFVFTDHALGPWVPLLRDFPHVIHCHDFLAQRSALREVPENPTNWSGRQYQSFIRDGYKNGKNFISISYKTQDDLHKLLDFVPHRSDVIYNGLTQPFAPVVDKNSVLFELGQKLNLDLSSGFILNVAGNQWYKNRRGVMEIYNAWRESTTMKTPLLMIGAQPNALLCDVFEKSKYKNDIHFVTGLDDSLVRKAYATASAFLFPSLDEGFGWPIAEAMASGCPTITTDRAPMNEVAGNAAFFIKRRPYEKHEVPKWAAEAAKQIDIIMKLAEDVREEVIMNGLKNSSRFKSSSALDQIESVYHQIMATEKQVISTTVK